MEQTKLDCAIVRDLLPGYVDGVTSEATNAAVETHLCDCAACRDILIAMRAEFEPPTKAAPEVDYLKKQQDAERRRKRNYALVYLGLILLVICELYIHLYPLNGTDVENLYDEASFPIFSIEPHELEETVIEVAGQKVYYIEWGNPTWQCATIDIGPNGIDAWAGGAFIRDHGAINRINGDTIYIIFTVSRKSLLYSGGGETFGLAIRLVDRQVADLWN